MSKITMMVGIPSSGKSQFTEMFEVINKAKVLSSDKMREEIYRDVNHQGNNGDLFQIIYKKAKEFLKEGNDVIIDATNINRKRRISFNKEFKDFKREAIYMDTPYEVCCNRNAERDRVVPEHVLERMYKSLQIPTYVEGWDSIKYIHTISKRDDIKGVLSKEQREEIERIIYQKKDYHELFNFLVFFPEFRRILELAQDNSHHSFTVSRHTYHVWKYILENYDAEIKMLWVALFHDVGKHFCKSFKNNKGEEVRYANFIGHENVSAQIACNRLYTLGYDDEFIMEVVELVQNHMKLLQINYEEKAIDKLIDLIGISRFQLLEDFREADVSAK